MRPQLTRLIARALPWEFAPEAAVASWPESAPLAALLSAGTGTAARWSILCAPSRVSRLRAPTPQAVAEALRRLGPPAGPGEAIAPIVPEGFPFVQGSIVALDYELGEAVEPAVLRGVGHPDRSPATPAMTIARCDGALVHDAADDTWLAVGDPDETARLVDFIVRRPAPDSTGGFTFREPRSLTGRAGFESAVARAVALIHAGDCFQVNLAHHLESEFEGSARAAFLAMLRAAAPPFAAILDLEPADPSADALLSMSPELFLAADLSPAGTRRVVTRPIKGTRRADRDGAARRDLLAAPKDAAELAMIIDLMRNDLGRVCDLGSVRVDEPRTVETAANGALLHTVGAVSGRLRDDATFADLIAATFPPGSVTGAPKVRAMQVIRELEPRPRGAYCGAVGFVSDHGPMCLNVAIRTATVGGAPRRLTFPVGAGIVAESDPAAEWHETLAKATTLMEVFGAASGRRSPANAAP